MSLLLEEACDSVLSHEALCVTLRTLTVRMRAITSLGKGAVVSLVTQGPVALLDSPRRGIA